MKREKAIIHTRAIDNKILNLRDKKVILDSDLAEIYGITTGRLNEQIKRNVERFPDDFRFQLTASEYKLLISQFAISKKGRGGRRKLPYVFTEHGVIMAANVLNTKRAVQMSVFVVRAFIRLRETIASHKDLARKLEELERKIEHHDEEIESIFEAIRELMETPEPPKKQLGFTVGEKRARYGVKA